MKKKLYLVMMLSIALGYNQYALSQALETKEYFIQHAVNKYFDLPMSAESVGMGRSLDPVSSGLWSILENPAGLGGFDLYGLSLQYTYNEISGKDVILVPRDPSLIPDIDEEFHSGNFLYAMPLPREFGTLGIAFTGGRSEVDDSYQTETARYAATLAYGVQLNPALRLGYSLSYIYDEEDNIFTDYKMNDGIRNTLGLQFIPAESWTLGFYGFYGLGDIDSNISGLGKQDGDRESYSLNLGVSKYFETSTTLAVSLRYMNHDLDSDIITGPMIQNTGEWGSEWSVHAGVEQEIAESLVVRAGYSFNNIDYHFNDTGAVISLTDTLEFSSVSIGFGYQFKENLALNYALEHPFIGDSDFYNTINLILLF